MVILAYALAALVGISLGLIGSGGSILTVPILVYVMGIEPVHATAYSLFIVGTTALVGAIQKSFQSTVDYKTIILFGIPSLLAVYTTRLWIVPASPDVLFNISGFVFTKSLFLLILFAVVMILASYSMIKPAKIDNAQTAETRKINYKMLFLQGIAVGGLTGLVGVGGGFLIIPALVFFARIPMKTAIGTSLFIIAANALIGFTGDLQGDQNMDWPLLFGFAAVSIIGIFIGNYLCKKIDGSKLKSVFGWFVLAMGIYILLKELIFKF